MKQLLPALIALAPLVLAAGPAVAQAQTQWTGVVAPNASVDVVNIRGTIQAVLSTDGMVHVTARPSDPSVMRVEIFEHAGGVKVCTLPVEQSGTPRGDCTSNNNRREPWPKRDEADLRVDIEVSVPRGVRLGATSVSGDIRVEQLQSELQLTMVSGRVDVEVAGFPTRITAVSGDVHIAVPANADADFQATTMSGDIDSDVPLNTSVRRVRVGPKNVRGTIGNGGPDLQVTTVSGDIELRQR